MKNEMETKEYMGFIDASWLCRYAMVCFLVLDGSCEDNTGIALRRTLSDWSCLALIPYTVGPKPGDPTSTFDFVVHGSP